MLKRIFGLLFICSNIYAISGPYQADRYFQNTGGILTHISPLTLPKDKAVDIQNFILDDRGQLTARSGFQILNSTFGATLLSTQPVTGGGYHNTAASGGSDFFAVVVGTNIYRTTTNFTSTSTWSNVTGTVTVTGISSNLAQHTSLNDVEIFCNDKDQPFYVPPTGNALAITTTTVTDTLPTAAKTCSTYISYLIVGNTTEGGVNYPTRIRWSDINNQNSWPALNYIDVEPNDGDKIVSIIAFKDSIYIFKRRSIYRLMSTGGAGANAFIIRPFSRNIGTYAKNSVRVIPNVGIAFLAGQTQYILGDNELSSFNYSQLEAIGDDVQRNFDVVQHNQWQNSVSGVYPQRYQYLISVSTAGSTTTESLVYDYIKKGWTSYIGINFNMLETAIDNTGRQVLLAGDFNGNVYEYSEGQNYDTPLNTQSGISTSYTTGWLSQEQPDFNKTYKYLYLFTVQNSTANIIVNTLYDYSNSIESSYPIGFTGQAVYDKAIYDTDVYATSGIIENRIELNREAKAIKLKFTGSSTAVNVAIAGWTIVYQPIDWKE